MSDIGVSYDLHYSPNPVGVDLKMSLSGTAMKVTLSGVPALAVTATPHYSGNVLNDALSSVGTLVVNAITLSAGAFAGQIMNGQSFKVGDVPTIPFNVQGVSGTLTPSNLTLSNFNGQLKIGGDFTLS